MRQLIPLALSVVAVSAPVPFALAGASPQARIPSVDEADGVQYVVTLDGMMCMECQKKVKGALEKIDGVSKVAVAWEKGVAEVTMKDPYAVLTLELVQKALAEHKEFTVKDVKRA